jgi:HSP20 family protein
MTLVVRNRNLSGGFVPRAYSFGSILDDFFFSDPLAKRPPSADDDQVKVRSFEDRHEISIAAPGLKKSDFNIQLKADKLTISYDACDEQEAETSRSFSTMAFSRSWSLAKGIIPDGIKAKYNAGVLKVIVARPEDEVPAEHSIKIN